jgi:hypothetical protein
MGVELGVELGVGLAGNKISSSSTGAAGAHAERIRTGIKTTDDQKKSRKRDFIVYALSSVPLERIKFSKWTFWG